MNTENHFARLQLAGWRQFQAIDIEFHPRLTVLTGTNGAGKSTILNVLSRHLGVSRPYLGTPTRQRGKTLFASGLFNISRRIFSWMRPSETDSPGSFRHFGQIEYSNGTSSSLILSTQTDLQYDLQVENQQVVMGFHFPSHRLLPTYKEVPNISFKGVTPSAAFQMMLNHSYASYMGQNTNSSVIFQLKTILASWAAIGEGNSVFQSDPIQLEAYNGFINVLRKIVPKEIGFRNLSIRPPNLVLETDTGEFLIDSASGGLTTLIEIAALVYTCSLSEPVSGRPFVVTFDEPENHLHPSLQRSLLPTLVDAFPQVQFIVATHSPFMVSSLKDSNVYVLRYTPSTEEDLASQASSVRRISSIRLDHVNRAGTAGEMLREVLGVPVTLPAWVESDLQAIVGRYQRIAIDDDTLEQFRLDISAAGLDDLFTDALTMLGAGR
jgi:energy-coupling factor transporter ATP-binding protein EcfA2